VSRRESPEERAERILAELRAATSEAAGVLKDLQAAARTARAQIDEYLPREVERVVNAYIEQVQQQLDAWHAAMIADVQASMDRAAARADRAIDAAVGIEMLAMVVVREVAAHKRFVDGEPVIVYGDPDPGDRIRPTG
jgi:hypothetical protein